MAIELYEHNQETYEKILSMFESSNRVGVVQPTGTGKSFLFLKWMEDYSQDNFVVLSPSTEIFTQLQEYSDDAQNLGLLGNVQMISYQSLLRMTDEEIRSIHSDKMVLDEFHRTGAEQWGPAIQKLLEANPKTQILGASATPVRYLDNTRDMSSELFDRNLAVEMTLGEAVRKGILPTPKYVPVWYDIEGKMAQYGRDISKVKNKEERKELEEKLMQLKRRLENAYGAEEIFKKNMPHDHGKFIVFCRDKEHLNEMKKTVPLWLRGVNKNVRCYVSISAQEDKDVQLQSFKRDSGEDAVKLLFTIDRLNEGVHVKGIDGVIMLRPTASPIIYLQQMGRALAAGNKSPLIFDMVNNYQNVQVPLGTGETRNVFDFEIHDDEANIGDFRIFEDMMEFTLLFDELESKLYLSFDEIWYRTFDLYVAYKNEFGMEPLSDSFYSGINLWNWCRTQRYEFKNGNLSEQRIQILQSVGFIFDPFDAEWQSKLDLCIAFKNEFSCLPTSHSVYHGEAIGAWCSRQRHEFKNGNLSDDKIQKLQSIGFVFEPIHDYKWLCNLDLYIAYKKEYGLEPAHSAVYRGKRIGVWRLRQKNAFEAGKLSSDQIEKLESAGFVFDSEEFEWRRKLDLYIAYQKEFNCSPFQKTDYQGENLRYWCSAQKKAFRDGTLSDEKIQMLQAAGFVFESRIDKEEQMWQKKFDLYVAFKKEFGDEPSNSTIFHNERIGKWCIKQRGLFVNGKLSGDRLQKLLDAGFVFESRKLLDAHAWQSKLNLYIAYKKEFDCEPSQQCVYKGENIGAWCYTQMQSYKKGKLSDDRMRKLIEAGFPLGRNYELSSPNDTVADLISNAQQRAQQGRKEANTVIEKDLDVDFSFDK